MRYIPPGVTDIQLYGVCKATVHDPDPGYYRYCFHNNHAHIQSPAFLGVLLDWSLLNCPRLLLVRCAVLAAVRDIVHKHLWNGLTTDTVTAEQQPSSQQTTLSDAQEAPTGIPQIGSRDLGESYMLSLELCDQSLCCMPGNTANDAAENDAQALLASYGFKVAFGGIYCIDDYRAM